MKGAAVGPTPPPPHLPPSPPGSSRVLGANPRLALTTRPFVTAFSSAKAKFTDSLAEPSLGQFGGITRGFSSDRRRDLPLRCRGGTRLVGSAGANKVSRCAVKRHEKRKPGRPAASTHGCRDPAPLEEALGCEGNQKQRVTSKSDPAAPIVGVGLTAVTDCSKYIAAIQFHQLLPRLPSSSQPRKRTTQREK